MTKKIRLDGFGKTNYHAVISALHTFVFRTAHMKHPQVRKKQARGQHLKAKAPKH